MTPPSVAEANAAPDLGVLFVHGIGNQIAGQTLVQFGDPLLQWLDEWHSSKLPDEVAKLRDDLQLTEEDIPKLRPVVLSLVAEAKAARAASKAEDLTVAAFAKLRDDLPKLTEEDIPKLRPVVLSPVAEVKAAKAAAEAEDLPDAQPAREGFFWPNVTNARIKTEGGIPAHAHVEIPVTSDNNGQPKRWILAESCWAQAFVPPTFKDLAYWGLVVYPWTNATHYGSQIRRKWSGAYNRERGLRRALAIAEALVAIAFLFVISVPISIIVVALLALLLVLAIPPIPSLRRMLLRVQQALAGTLGDCFVLAYSPLQRAAIVSHVRRDLEWLISQGCEKIAVIAHSQGAAIAFKALCTGVLKRFCEAKAVDSEASAPQFRETILITFGSGLAKLSELERVLDRDRKLGWIAIGGLALIGLSLEFFNVINVIPFVEPSKGLGVLCAFWGALLWISGVGSGAVARPSPDDFEPHRNFGCDTKWRDYYASRDPVPNGPLFDEDQWRDYYASHDRVANGQLFDANRPFLEGEEVHNFASMWQDHTSYWLNRDEFVPAVVRDLAELSQRPLLNLQQGDEKKIQTAAARRAARVQWLARASSAIWVVAAVVMITRWSDLPRVGSTLLSQLPLLEKAFGWFGIKEISNGKFATSLLAEELAGIVAVLVCGAVAFQVVRLLWQIWTWWDTRALLQRKSYGSEWPRWLFFVVTLALVNAGILVSMGLPTTIVATTPPNYGISFIVYLFTPGFVAGGIIYLWWLMWWLIKRREHAVPTFWPAAVAALMVAPIVALSLIINISDGYRLGILVGLVVLGCFLIHDFDGRIQAERKTYATSVVGPDA